MTALPFVWDEVNALLRYDPGTGKFHWRERSPEFFPGRSKTREHECAVWNARYAGKPAGRLNISTGYIEISLHGRRYQAHRLAILLTTGEWPPEVVDHINGVRDDNRRANLRCVAHWQNMQNTAAHRDSSSRHVGVSWDSARQAWTAGITRRGAKYNLGRFKTESAAAAAYIEAKGRLHETFRGEK